MTPSEIAGIGARARWARWRARPRHERMEKFIERITVTGCWIWMGTVDREGYGRVRDGRRLLRAHRVMYESLRGEIPAGLVPDHLCRVTSCVNPDHIEPVTQQVNILRGEGLAARNAAKTACPKGHLLDRISMNNGRAERTCGECRRSHWRARDARRKQKRLEVRNGGLRSAS